MSDNPDDSRAIQLYGEVNEENCKNLVAALYYLKANTKPLEDESIPPIDILLSTEGGSVQDMFSVYDCVRDVSKEIDVTVFGMGKVMSAGILLLACGTKGKTKSRKEL